MLGPRGAIGFLIGVLTIWGVAAAVNTAFAHGSPALYDMHTVEYLDGEVIEDATVQLQQTRDDCIMTMSGSFWTIAVENKLNVQWVSESTTTEYVFSALLTYPDGVETLLVSRCIAGPRA